MFVKYLIRLSLAKNFHIIFKTQTIFLQKLHFSENFAKSGDLEITDSIFGRTKRGLVETRYPIRVFWN